MDSYNPRYVSEIQDLLDDPQELLHDYRQWSDLPRARHVMTRQEETTLKNEDFLREMKELKMEMENSTIRDGLKSANSEQSVQSEKPILFSL